MLFCAFLPSAATRAEDLDSTLSSKGDFLSTVIPFRQTGLTFVFRRRNILSYIQYNNFEITEIKIYSVFDYLYKQYEETKSDEIKMKLNFQVRHYLMDLNFMIQYWQKLLNYLKYNPLEIKTYSKIFNALYDTEEKRMDYYNALPEERQQINKKIRKIVKKEIRKKRTKGFFNKE